MVRFLKNFLNSGFDLVNCERLHDKLREALGSFQLFAREVHITGIQNNRYVGPDGQEFFHKSLFHPFHKQRLKGVAFIAPNFPNQ